MPEAHPVNVEGSLGLHSWLNYSRDLKLNCTRATNTHASREGREGHTKFTHTLAGGYYSLAIMADGSVWSWGAGVSGKLGHGDEQSQLLPKKVYE